MSRFAQSCQIDIKQASEEYWSSSVTKSWATVTYAKQVTMRKGNFVHQRILLHWFSMFCASRNAYKMIIFALSTWFLWFCASSTAWSISCSRIVAADCLPPSVVAFLNEYLTERHILDMLHHLAIKVGDVTTATQMVWMFVRPPGWHHTRRHDQ